MLQSIRDRATGWLAYVIIILISIPFALWGVNSYFDGAAPSDAAEVNGIPISQRELRDAFQQERSLQQRRLGTNIDLTPFEPALRQQALQRLIDDRVLSEAAAAAGMRVGDEELNRSIQQVPLFQSEGRFDPERYQRMVAAQGYTSAQFEESYRNDLMIAQLRDAISGSALLTEQEMRRVVELWFQQRDVAFIRLALAEQAEQIEIGDDELRTYYDENKDQFTSSERIKVDYIDLDLDKMAAAIAIDDDDIENEYDARKRSYTTEAERSLSQILFPLAADAGEAEVEAARERADALYRRIESGDLSFDQALEQARADGADGGEVGVYFPGMFESALEQALFALQQQDAVSEPVRSGSGIHILRLDRYTPEQVTPFDEVKEDIKLSLQRERAEAEFFDSVDRLGTLSYENPDSLDVAAEQLGLTVQQSEWFTRAGGEPGADGDASLGSLAPVRAAAFGDDVLNQGVNSEPLELSPTRVVVIRQAEYEPSAPLDFEQARERIEQRLRNERAAETLQTRLDELYRRAEQGESLTAIAASEDGLEVEELGLIARADAPADRAILNEAFRLPPPPPAGRPLLGKASLSNGDRALVAVREIVPGKFEEVDEQELEALRGRLSAQIGGVQFDAFKESLRGDAEIVTYSEREPTNY